MTTARVVSMRRRTAGRAHNDEDGVGGGVRGPRGARAIGKTGGSSTGGGEKTMHRGWRRRAETRQRVVRRQTFVAGEVARVATRKLKTRDERISRAVGSALAQLPLLGAALPLPDAFAARADAEGGGDRNGNGNRDGDGDGGDRSGGGGLRHRRFGTVVREEGAQMQMVRAHASFKQEGIEALRQHLENTVGDGGSTGQTDGAKARHAKGGAKHKKGKAKGGSNSSKMADVEEDAEGERMRRRRDAKKRMADVAAARRAAGRTLQVQTQTMRSMIGGGVGRRGRIGEKRPKDL